MSFDLFQITRYSNRATSLPGYFRRMNKGSHIQGNERSIRKQLTKYRPQSLPSSFLKDLNFNTLRLLNFSVKVNAVRRGSFAISNRNLSKLKDLGFSFSQKWTDATRMLIYSPNIITKRYFTKQNLCLFNVIYCKVLKTRTINYFADNSLCIKKISKSNNHVFVFKFTKIMEVLKS